MQHTSYDVYCILYDVVVQWSPVARVVAVAEAGGRAGPVAGLFKPSGPAPQVAGRITPNTPPPSFTPTDPAIYTPATPRAF